MKKQFALGALAGASALVIAAPFVAQMAGAQGLSSSSTSTSAAGTASAGDERRGPPMFAMQNPTQADVQSMIDRDTQFLANVDAAVTLQKQATQTHKTALEAALSITDEAQRTAAVRAAHEAMRTTIQDAMTANPDLRIGMHFGGGKGHGGPGHGRGPEHLAEKLGMTAEELKTALDSGKTIEQIAQEKGITLPARPQRPDRGQPAPVQQ